MTPERLEELKHALWESRNPHMVKCKACGSAPGTRCYGNGPMQSMHPNRAYPFPASGVDELLAHIDSLTRKLDAVMVLADSDEDIDQGGRYSTVDPFHHGRNNLRIDIYDALQTP